jgi:2-oxoglutarate ferredoxin oxidoreductase subunit beta
MNDMSPPDDAQGLGTDQEVRWCPGCGDYAILKAVQRTLPRIGADPRRPCSSRASAARAAFPYYVESYGFHTIHGRAPAIATGHEARQPRARRVDGHRRRRRAVDRRQPHDAPAAPEPRLPDPAVQQRDLRPDQGTVLADQPLGTNRRRRPLARSTPRKPCAFALGAGARFVARGFDVSKELPEVLKAAHAHKGAAFVEIFQNCIVYNKDRFDDFAAPKGAEDRSSSG